MPVLVPKPTSIMHVNARVLLKPATSIFRLFTGVSGRMALGCMNFRIGSEPRRFLKELQGIAALNGGANR
jgi:hypothetical protein